MKSHPEHTSKPLLNFKISTGPYNSFVDNIITLCNENRPKVICVANVHMFVESQKDPTFLSVINSADIVTPDGKPLTWALNLLYGIKQDRVAGMDLLPDLLKRMEKESISAFFYGGSEEMLGKTKDYLHNKFPGLKIAGTFSPPFRPLTKEEDEEVVSLLTKSAPGIIFVVLGCPKQEKWMASMKNSLNTVMIGVGGALPVMIGIQKRAPLWMQNFGLEWLFRLLQEPKRLFKRYAETNSLFIWKISKEYIKLKILVPLRISKIQP